MRGPARGAAGRSEKCTGTGIPRARPRAEGGGAERMGSNHSAQRSDFRRRDGGRDLGPPTQRTRLGLEVEPCRLQRGPPPEHARGNRGPGPRARGGLGPSAWSPCPRSQLLQSPPLAAQETQHSHRYGRPHLRPAAGTGSSASTQTGCADWGARVPCRRMKASRHTQGCAWARVVPAECAGAAPTLGCQWCCVHSTPSGKQGCGPQLWPEGRVVTSGPGAPGVYGIPEPSPGSGRGPEGSRACPGLRSRPGICGACRPLQAPARVQHSRLVAGLPSGRESTAKWGTEGVWYFIKPRKPTRVPVWRLRAVTGGEGAHPPGRGPLSHPAPCSRATAAGSPSPGTGGGQLGRQQLDWGGQGEWTLGGCPVRVLVLHPGCACGHVTCSLCALASSSVQRGGS